jgi:antitoxin ParD1/3/4
MAQNISVTLDDPLAQFVGDQIDSGRFATASEVIHAGLRMLEDRETKLRLLHEALDEGERSGPAEPFDFDAFIGRKLQKTGRSVE